MSNKITPIVLCGGTGTRLWPLSRKSFPKQFINLCDKDNRSLLQNTVLRIKDSNKFSDPILICSDEHRFIVAEQMREIDIEPKAIILEPCSRNTAPAITLATILTMQFEENPTLLVLSSDHQINNSEKFMKSIEIGEKYSNKKRIVTYGVIPTAPETGYGYIQSKKPLDKLNPIGEDILRFIEKPNIDKAKKFLVDKSFTWNSGIFLFQANVILKELNRFEPEIIKYCKKSIIESKKDLDFIRINEESYKYCQDISIDFAVMEKTNLGTVIPLDVGWSDIGSWDSVWKNSNKDERGNVTEGRIILKDSKDSYFNSENRLLVGLGLTDLVVVDTSDAILIADKKRTQDVKNIVKLLKEKNISESQEHLKVFRPWGYYVSISESSTWKVKLIAVKTGQKISLQRHQYRSEHWIVVQGKALVQLANDIKNLNENESIYIPSQTKHRLSNNGKKTLKIIEVQTGTYLGEDDIERFEDNYGRVDL